MRSDRNPLYVIWKGMMARCYKPKTRSYPNYGGKGIKVCQRWHDFDLFASDMVPKPFDKATLERKDGTKDYSPNNCVWVTCKEQQRNRKNNHLLTHAGKTQCLTAWAEEVSIPANCLRARKRNGWTDSEALTKPLNRLVLTIDGQTKSLCQLAMEKGVRFCTVWARIKRGYPPHLLFRRCYQKGLTTTKRKEKHESRNRSDTRRH